MKHASLLLPDSHLPDAEQHEDAAGSFLRAVTLADGAGDSLLGTAALMHLGVSLDDAGQTREALESFSTRPHAVLPFCDTTPISLRNC